MFLHMLLPLSHQNFTHLQLRYLPYVNKAGNLQLYIQFNTDTTGANYRFAYI